MKFVFLTIFDKNVWKNSFFDIANCGKLCGNCGKPCKISFLVKKETDVPVENFYHLITRLAFSMLLISTKYHRIIHIICTNAHCMQVRFLVLVHFCIPLRDDVLRK